MTGYGRAAKVSLFDIWCERSRFEAAALSCMLKIKDDMMDHFTMAMGKLGWMHHRIHNIMLHHSYTVKIIIGV
jgi:hypothetical protein